MNQLFRFGSILTVICLVATLVLAVTYEITKPKIEQYEKQEEERALLAIMPQADSFVKKSLDGIDYFESLRGNELIGYCVRVLGSGYSGYIRIIAGVDLNGVIQGVQILEHTETPGLGSRISEVRPGEKEPWFTAQFKGKQGKTVTLKRDIDAITGATISSRAVTDAVRNAVNDFLAKVNR